MSASRTYLDHAATTPVDTRVLEAMLPYFTDQFGNPGSLHYWGQRAEYAVNNARQQVAGLLGCSSEEVIFTSGGSESNSLALGGVAFESRRRRNADRLLTTAIEHPSVLNTMIDLEHNHGFKLELIPIDNKGIIHIDRLEEMLSEDVAIVSIMYANNEVGSVNPISEAGEICREHDIPLHVDALQAVNHLEIAVEDLNVDLLSLGAHKFYGPKGVGLLYKREGIAMHPRQHGGGQEFGLRAGTQNVPLIVGFAEALKFARKEVDSITTHCHNLQTTIIDTVLAELSGVELTGHPVMRLENHASFVFEGIDSNSLLSGLDIAGFACSSGSACKVGDPKPSEVLSALGLPEELALGALRVSVGRATTTDSVDHFLITLSTLINQLRKAN